MKTVYSTKEYDKFRRLKGNRCVDISRVRKIIASVKKVGYVTSPVIVNEKMEVIDGRARVDAFSRLEIPVEYVIHEGAGWDECVALNINQTKWKTRDYIDGYAERGFESYVLLKKLMDEYLKYFPAIVIISAATETISASNNVVTEGRFYLDKDGYDIAKLILDYEKRFLDIFNSMGGANKIIIRCG